MLAYQRLDFFEISPEVDLSHRFITPAILRYTLEQFPGFGMHFPWSSSLLLALMYLKALSNGSRTQNNFTT